MISQSIASSSNGSDLLSGPLASSLMQSETGPVPRVPALRHHAANSSSHPAGAPSSLASPAWGNRLRQRNQLVSTESTPTQPDVRKGYYFVDGPEAVQIISEYTLENRLNASEQGETYECDSSQEEEEEERDEPCFTLGDYVRIRRLPADHPTLESAYPEDSTRLSTLSTQSLPTNSDSTTPCVEHDQDFASDMEMAKLSPLAYRITRIDRAEEVFASYRAKVEDELIDAVMMDDTSSGSGSVGGSGTKPDDMDTTSLGLMEQFAYQGWVYQLDRHASRYVADFEWFREDMLVFDSVATQEGTGDVTDEDEDGEEDAADEEKGQRNYPSSDNSKESDESYEQGHNGSDIDEMMEEEDDDDQTLDNGDLRDNPPPQSQQQLQEPRNSRSAMPLRRRLSVVSLSDMKSIWRNLW